MPERQALATLTLDMLDEAVRSGAASERIQRYLDVAVASVCALSKARRVEPEERLRRLASQAGLAVAYPLPVQDRVRIARLKTLTPAIQVEHVVQGIDADLRVLTIGPEALEIWGTPGTPDHPFASAAALFYEIDSCLRWAFDHDEVSDFLLTPEA